MSPSTATHREEEQGRRTRREVREEPLRHRVVSERTSEYGVVLVELGPDVAADPYSVKEDHPTLHPLGEVRLEHPPDLVTQQKLEGVWVGPLDRFHQPVVALDQGDVVLEEVRPVEVLPQAVHRLRQ